MELGQAGGQLAGRHGAQAPRPKGEHIDIERPKIDCLSLVMCPLLAQLKTGFFSIFFAAAVYSTTEANKASLKQSIILRCLWASRRNDRHASRQE